MRAKSYVIPALVLSLVGATALAWHQYQELVTLRADALAGEDRRAMDARLADLERHNRELEAKLAALRAGKIDGADSSIAADNSSTDREAKPAALLTALAEQGGGQFAGESKKDAEMELLGALADLPEFQQLIAMQQRGKIDSKYAALFKKLNLTPEQQQQFETLLADRQSAFADAMIAAHDQGLTGKDARNMAMAVAKSTQKDIDNSIKNMLGTQGYNQYQNYERTMPQRETVNQLAQRLSYTAAPLTPQQQDQLVQTLASSARQQAVAAANAAAATGQKAVRQPVTVAPLPGQLTSLGIGSSNSVVIVPAAVSKAQTFLSTQQLAALQQMQQEQNAQQALGNLLRNGGAKPKTPGKG